MSHKPTSSSKMDVLELFRFIDWVMTLSTELDNQFRVDVAQFEAEAKMRYVTSIERLAIQEGMEKGMEKGMQQAMRESLANILHVRFGVMPARVTALIERVEDIDTLRELQRQAVVVDSLAAFEQLLARIE